MVRPGNIVNQVVSSAAIPFTSTFGTNGAARGPGFVFREDYQLLGGATFGLRYSY